MARIRKFSAYRRIERPYTRISKFKKRSFVKVRPNINIVRYEMGNLTRKFSYSLFLKAKSNLQIRHNALEAARLTSNRLLESRLGKQGFKLKICVFPHHVLRENPIAAGAGADRMSTGMKKSFGKSIGTAARVKAGQVIFKVDVNKQNLAVARTALKRASQKMPCSFAIELKQSK